MTSIIQNIASNSEDEYRQLPHNLDAEQQLLGALLVNNDLFDKISNYLKVDYFFCSLKLVFFASVIFFSSSSRAHRIKTQMVRTFIIIN